MKNFITFLGLLAILAVALSSCAIAEDSSGSTTSNSQRISSQVSSITSVNAEKVNADALTSILGAAIIKDESSPLYKEPVITSETLLTIPVNAPIIFSGGDNDVNISANDPIPFYYNDNEWTYVEYEGIRGWVEAKNFELIINESNLISAEQAKEFVIRELGIVESDNVAFGRCSLQRELGDTITWIVEFDGDKAYGWYSLTATTGDIYADGKTMR